MEEGKLLCWAQPSCRSPRQRNRTEPGSASRDPSLSPRRRPKAPSRAPPARGRSLQEQGPSSVRAPRPGPGAAPSPSSRAAGWLAPSFPTSPRALGQSKPLLRFLPLPLSTIPPSEEPKFQRLSFLPAPWKGGSLSSVVSNQQVKTCPVGICHYSLRAPLATLP